MRTRTIVTAVILSAGASAGIVSPEASASPPPDPTVAARAPAGAPPRLVQAARALLARNGRPLPAALQALVLARRTPAAPAAAPDTAVLRGLVRELDGLEPEELAARHEHFRPLCDAEGYPLVGNLPRKSSSSPVADFCAGVRTELQASR